ncbi:MAG: hypothetical protein ACRD5Z_01420, partial [Bryobacteraceae bacterium]
AEGIQTAAVPSRKPKAIRWMGTTTTLAVVGVGAFFALWDPTVPRVPNPPDNRFGGRREPGLVSKLQRQAKAPNAT